MANSEGYGQPAKPIADQATLTGHVLEPVTIGGWCGCSDGSQAEFRWIGGRLTLVAVRTAEESAAAGAAYAATRAEDGSAR